MSTRWPNLAMAIASLIFTSIYLALDRPLWILGFNASTCVLNTVIWLLRSPPNCPT